jgi:hypothetical protein
MRLKTDLLDVLLAATEPGATGGLDAMNCNGTAAPRWAW